jgi:hypothetical protein
LVHELAEPYPYMSTDDTATAAALVPVEHRLPALLVADRDDQPYAVVPGSQLVGRLVTDFALQDPPPAAGFDDQDFDDVPDRLVGLTVAMGVPPLGRSREWGGCRAAGSGRRRSAPPPVSCASQLSWRARTPRWSPSSGATATNPGWSARTAARLMERLIGGT